MIRSTGILSFFIIVQAHLTSPSVFEELEDVATQAENHMGDISDDYRHLLGVKMKNDSEAGASSNMSAKNCVQDADLPNHFDARERWTECSPTFRHILDQGNCGACWVFGPGRMFTDRLCIKSGGKMTSFRSVQHLLSCVGNENDCEGGWPIDTLDYLVKKGVVTGGDYHSKQGCQPYKIPPCAHHVNHTGLELCSKKRTAKTPKCVHDCYNSEYGVCYCKDKVKALSAYKVDACSAQKEIYENGPIIATFKVNKDFLHYKSGVYSHKYGKFVGYHCAELIGWGYENGVPYWLLINSWNKSWGDEGTFKFLRGKNECEIETYMAASGV